MPSGTSHRLLAILTGLIGAVIAAPSGQRPDHSDRSLLLNPDSPEMHRRAPDIARVRPQTTRGVIRLELRRSTAPHGVYRFYNSVRRGDYITKATIEYEASASLR